MFRRLSPICLILLLSMFCLGAAALPAMAASQDAAALKESLRQVLREHPELVMDVLKENSEMVLEIAQQGNMLRKRKAMLAQWQEDAKTAKLVDLKNRAFRGAASAPVTIVAYSDFTCPYCRQVEYIMLQLLKKYEGKIRVTFKALPKEDPFSLAAAKYSVAAFRLDEKKGWEFFDLLFKETEKYEREGDDFLKQAAADMGFDFRKLKSEAGTAEVQAILDADRKEADSLGISGTPHFLVNDLLVRGAVSKDLFEEAINMALTLKGIK